MNWPMSVYVVIVQRTFGWKSANASVTPYWPPGCRLSRTSLGRHQFYADPYSRGFIAPKVSPAEVTQTVICARPRTDRPHVRRQTHAALVSFVLICQRRPGRTSSRQAKQANCPQAHHASHRMRLHAAHRGQSPSLCRLMQGAPVQLDDISPQSSLDWL